jgi:riboflavin biosynthesis pyrimidine reductase
VFAAAVSWELTSGGESRVGAMRMLTEHGPTPSGVVTEHVALTGPNGADQAFVRLNMISSADGGSAVGGTSGALGNREDHAVFGALREHADAVLVGMATVVAEHYQPPKFPHLRIYVIAKTPDVSGAPGLFASGRATLVLPEDAGPGPEGVPDLRAGTGGQVDLRKVASLLAGKVVVMEGGPTLAGQMVTLGLVDELFLTVAPRVIAGGSARVAHGPDADPTPWQLLHGFVDDQGFLFLRYGQASTLDV